MAKLLGLSYPGGPEVARAAAAGNGESIRLPRPLLGPDSLDFSFSGLKTAVRLAAQAEAGDRGQLTAAQVADIAAAFQAAVVETLVTKCLRALDASGLKRLVVAGGVGANAMLRQQLAEAVGARGARVYYPRPIYCTDNAAMIAYAGWCRRVDARPAPADIMARPRWSLDELQPPGANAG